MGDDRAVRHVRRPAQRWYAAMLLVGCMAVGAVAASSPDGSLALGSAVSEITYSDPAGDATNGAPELTTVRVSDSAGAIRWAVTVPGLPAVETYLELHIDADQNPATGSGGTYTAGSEYALILDGEDFGKDWWRWGGSSWVLLSESAMASEYRSGVWTTGVRAADMNNIRSLNFRVFTWRFRDDRIYGIDVTDPFSYTLGQQPPPPPPPPTPPPAKRLAITGLTQSPVRPTAGDEFTIVARVVRVGWSGRYNGDGFCTVNVAGRRLMVVDGRVTPGRVECTFTVPASASGKVIAGSVTVSESGARAVRAFKARVQSSGPRLSAVGVEMSPKGGPEAGKQFYYSLGVGIHGGSSEPGRIRTGSVSCKATIGRTVLKVFDARLRPLSGVRCGWAIPHGRQGETLNGIVLVKSEGGVLRHRFTRRVR